MAIPSSGWSPGIVTTRCLAITGGGIVLDWKHCGRLNQPSWLSAQYCHTYLVSYLLDLNVLKMYLSTQMNFFSSRLSTVKSPVGQTGTDRHFATEHYGVTSMDGSAKCVWKELTWEIAMSTVWVKITLLRFSGIFPKRLRIFKQNFTRLLHAQIYAKLQNLI